MEGDPEGGRGSDGGRGKRGKPCRWVPLSLHLTQRVKDDASSMPLLDRYTL